MVRLLVNVPRWLLLASLVLAPWAYGSTRPWAIEGLSFLTGGLSLLWLLECAAQRRRPGVPLWALFPVLGLLLQGWWMVFNAHSSFDADLNALLPRSAPIAGAPGSANAAASLSTMFLFTGLLGTFLFCCELAQDSVWRRRLWATMAATGFSIAVFGVVQKIGGEAVLALVWEPEKRDITSNFATFRYRGNAAAYLNLILPLMAGLSFLTFRRQDQPWSKTLWTAGLFVLVLGIQLNPSRAGWFIALLLGVLLGIKMLWSYVKRRADFNEESLLTISLMLLLALIAIVSMASFGNWQTSWERFTSLGFDVKDRSPVEIYLKMVPDAGVLGFGPGTFSTVFPSYQQTYDFGSRPFPPFWKEGIFPHAHQDYLEGLIEWGYLGALLWSILIFGGMVRAMNRYFERRSSISLRWLLFCSGLALLGILIQAAVDFPLQIASIELYVLVLLGICWGARSSAEKKTPVT